MYQSSAQSEFPDHSSIKEHKFCGQWGWPQAPVLALTQETALSATELGHVGLADDETRGIKPRSP
jgi:hypothetical protein